jgi:flap endonuclease GEN
MGVKELWTILGPVAEPSTVKELSGKTVAVDLSVWVCENSAAGWSQLNKITNPHLRNLFFRSSYLIKHGVQLVFVLEGEPSELKIQALLTRNVKKGTTEKKTRTSDVDADPDVRKQFTDILNTVC